MSDLQKVLKTMKKLVKSDMTARELANFQRAANHDYSCTCDVCRKFWKQIGNPDKGAN